MHERVVALYFVLVIVAAVSIGLACLMLTVFKLPIIVVAVLTGVTWVLTLAPLLGVLLGRQLRPSNKTTLQLISLFVAPLIFGSAVLLSLVYHLSWIVLFFAIGVFMAANAYYFLGPLSRKG